MLEEIKEIEILEEEDDELFLSEDRKEEIIEELFLIELDTGFDGWEEDIVEELEEELNENEFLYTIYSASVVADDFDYCIRAACPEIELSRDETFEIREEILKKMRFKFDFWDC